MPSKILFVFFAYLALACSESQHPYIDLISKPYFIDKSELLTVAFGNFSYPHTYFTSPKHFGGTSNLDMIDLFANIELDSTWQPKNYIETQSYAAFNQSKFGHRDRYRYTLDTHLAQHPVIYLDLGSNLPKNFSIQSMVKYLLHALQKAYKRYEWLLDLPHSHLNRGPNRVISKEDIDFVDKLLKGRVNQAQVESGLKTLARILYKYFDSKVVILIDSFDHALNNALFYAKAELQTDQDVFEPFKIVNRMAVNVFRYLPYTISFMTGLSRAALDLDRDLGCVSHYNFLDYHQFVGYFGHTEDQLDRLLVSNKFPMAERNEFIRYYKGHFIIDTETNLFSPHTIAQYFQKRKDDSEFFQASLKPYFFGTAKNSAILRFIRLPFFRNRLISLVNRGFVKFCPIKLFEKVHYDHYYLLRINDITFLNDLTESLAESLLLTMITHMGYLCYNRDRNFVLPSPEIEAYVNDALTLFYAPANATLHEIGSLFYTIINTEDQAQTKTLVEDFETKLSNLFVRLSTINGYTRINDIEYNFVTHKAIKKYQKDTKEKGNVWSSGSQLEIIIVTSRATNRTRAGVLQISCNQSAADVMRKAKRNVRPRVSQAPITYLGVSLDEKLQVKIEATTIISDI